MIYITGDCHKDFTRFTEENFSEQKHMTKDDYVIICGDFGGVWWSRDNSNSATDNFDLNWLQDRPFTTLFVDGNHENFDELYKYPVKEWHGGKVHELRSSVLHLMRGEVFEICGKRILAFGGAQSHDIQDGIIPWDDKKNWKETARKWRQQGKIFRIDHYSWWKEELPTPEEIDNARRNLEKCDYTVDYVITHDCPTDALVTYVALLGMSQSGKYKLDDRNILTEFFDELSENLQFRKWIFGHHHDNRNITDKYILLYEQIIRIG